MSGRGAVDAGVPVSGPPPTTLLRRVIRYGISGVFQTLVYYGAMAALVEGARLSPVNATVPATIIVIVTTYFVNRRWVFATDRPHASAFTRFVIASVLSIVLNRQLMSLAVDTLAWQYVYGLLLTTAVVTPVNFLLNYLWCFRPSGPRKD